MGAHQLPDKRFLGIQIKMKNAYWIIVGLVVGTGAGAMFGFDYALAGAGIGAVAGVAILAGMRAVSGPRN